MIHGRRVVVVLPAYSAEQTLERTCRDIPRDVVDELLLVDGPHLDRQRYETRVLTGAG